MRRSSAIGAPKRSTEDASLTTTRPEYGKTPNQILLSWNATRNVSVIPKSTNPDRIKENMVIAGHCVLHAAVT